eukprot:809449-Pelagomonas_calceolata.AAC.1
MQLPSSFRIAPCRDNIAMRWQAIAQCRDLIAVLPGPGKPYSSLLASDKLTRPIYQVMASALTNSTAM